MARLAERITATVLGCGSSGGVPRVGNVWGDCDPANPRNRRRRCSLLLTGTSADSETPTQVLIDTGCDLREQLLDAGVGQIDGVLYTHEHADHTHGIDDLRVLALNSKSRVDVYASRETNVRLHEAFGYCFTAPEGSPYPPILNAHTIEAGREVEIEGPGGAIRLLPFEQEHGDIVSLGYRVGNFAYSCDLSGIPAHAVEAVSGLDVWVLDALRHRPHPSHLSYSEALEWIMRMQPGTAVLTNMHVDLDYATVEAETPPHVTPAYDGMVIDVTKGKVLR